MSILSVVREIEAKVREAMQNGPVTPYYTLPLDKVYDVLNAALASEIICVLRYKQHYYMTTSIHQDSCRDSSRSIGRTKRNTASESPTASNSSAASLAWIPMASENAPSPHSRAVTRSPICCVKTSSPSGWSLRSTAIS